MKRFLLTSGLAAVLFAAMTLSAIADDRPTFDRAGGGQGLHKLQSCLSGLDLSADQKAAIQSIVAAARDGIKTAAETVRADHDQLQKDLAGGADKSVVGQDVINAHADREKLRAAVDAVRGQILAKLSADQQTSLNTCLQASRGSRGPGR